MEQEGLVGGIQKFSTGDGPGIRTTVFLKGCPLRCQWCHNPELIDPRNQLMHNPNRCIGCAHCAAVCPQSAIFFIDGVFAIDRDKCTSCFRCVEECCCEALRLAAKKMTVSQVLNLVEQDRGYYDRTGGGMTISGGECLLQLGFTAALIEEACRREIGVALDTSGQGDTHALYAMATKVDYILYDVKSIDDRVHRRVTGISNHLILEHLKTLAANVQINPKILVRMPLISGINDTSAIIGASCDFYVKNRLKRVMLLPYHEFGISKYNNLGLSSYSFSAPSEERLLEIWQKFENAGIKAEIAGREMHPHTP